MSARRLWPPRRGNADKPDATAGQSTPTGGSTGQPFGQPTPGTGQRTATDVVTAGAIGGGGLGFDDDPIVLSELEYDVLIEHLRLERMPVVLSVPSPGGTRAERAMLVDVAWKSLADKGYGRQVGLDPRLIRYLRLLAKPDREVDARLWLDRPTRALAATADGLAILVVKADNKLIMREASPAGMPRAVLSVVPERAAGPGESVALPTAVFEAAAKAANTRAGFEMALRQHGVRDRDAAALTTMIGDVLGQGQFGAAARDRWGARHRAGHVISFFDTPDGRYVQVRKSSVSGEPWSTIAPVDHRRLLQHITAMLDEVAGATTR